MFMVTITPLKSCGKRKFRPKNEKVNKPEKLPTGLIIRNELMQISI